MGQEQGSVVEAKIRDTTANPAPLGLLAFGMRMVPLNLHNPAAPLGLPCAILQAKAGTSFMGGGMACSGSFLTPNTSANTSC